MLFTLKSWLCVSRLNAATPRPVGWAYNSNTNDEIDDRSKHTHRVPYTRNNWQMDRVRYNSLKRNLWSTINLLLLLMYWYWSWKWIEDDREQWNKIVRMRFIYTFRVLFRASFTYDHKYMPLQSMISACVFLWMLQHTRIYLLSNI